MSTTPRLPSAVVGQGANVVTVRRHAPAVMDAFDAMYANTRRLIRAVSVVGNASVGGADRVGVATRVRQLMRCRYWRSAL
jgi:hypothetical protein